MNIKNELFDDKINVTLTIFHTEQDNFTEQTNNINNRTYYRTIEKLTNEDYEIEISNQPIQELELNNTL